MYHWVTWFSVADQFKTLPKWLLAGSETQTSTSYRQFGRDREKLNYCSFQLTISGKGIFKDSSGIYEVGPGKGFFFNTLDPDWEYFYPEGAAEPWKFIYVEFTGGNSIDVQRELVRRNGPVFTIADMEIARLIERYSSSGWSKVAISPSESAGMFNRLISVLVKGIEVDRKRLSGLVERAAGYIRRNIDQSINVGTVALALGVSREHLSRVFKEQAGIGLRDYIIRNKIETACYLIRSTSDTAKQIAARLSFGSPEQMSRIFKKIMGLTPVEYRKKHQMP